MPRTVSVARVHSKTTIPYPSDRSDCVQEASAEEVNPSTPFEKSLNARFAQQNNVLSDVYPDMHLHAPGCDMPIKELSICVYCAGNGQDYDTWSTNTGGHGLTTDMNKPGDKLQLQLWAYETSQITVAERFEQRKWCGPSQKV